VHRSFCFIRATALFAEAVRWSLLSLAQQEAPDLLLLEKLLLPWKDSGTRVIAALLAVFPCEFSHHYYYKGPLFLRYSDVLLRAEPNVTHHT